MFLPQLLQQGDTDFRFPFAVRILHIHRHRHFPGAMTAHGHHFLHGHIGHHLQMHRQFHPRVHGRRIRIDFRNGVERRSLRHIKSTEQPGKFRITIPNRLVSLRPSAAGGSQRQHQGSRPAKISSGGQPGNSHKAHA